MCKKKRKTRDKIPTACLEESLIFCREDKKLSSTTDLDLDLSFTSLICQLFLVSWINKKIPGLSYRERGEEEEEESVFRGRCRITRRRRRRRMHGKHRPNLFRHKTWQLRFSGVAFIDAPQTVCDTRAGPDWGEQLVRAEQPSVELPPPGGWRVEGGGWRPCAVLVSGL